MSKIEINKLTNVAKKNGKTVARCPACAAQGGDAKGNNLVVFNDGKFGCAAFPKDKAHNRMILELVGVKTAGVGSCHVPIRRVVHPPSTVIKVVGRLGRSFSTAPGTTDTETTQTQATCEMTTTQEAALEACPPCPPEDAPVPAEPVYTGPKVPLVVQQRIERDRRMREEQIAQPDQDEEPVVCEPSVTVTTV